MRRHAGTKFTLAVWVSAAALAGMSLSARPALAAATGTISGTVTASASDISGVTVGIYDTSDDFITSTTTASDGTYSVTGLTAESYLVCFDASFATGGSSTTGYASQCYNDVPWTPGTALPAGATQVAVASGQTVTGIDASLLANGQISGTVTAASGGGDLSSVNVDVFDSNGNSVAEAGTASDGTYTVSGLAPSATGYTVCFDPTSATGGSSTTGYQGQCYNDVIWTPGSAPPTGTTQVPVTAGQTTTGINAALSADGAISGTVTAASGGAGVSGVGVDVYNGSGLLVADGDTASDGTYTVTSLAPGSYTVCFNAEFATSTTGFASQCYKDIAWPPGGPLPAGTTSVAVTEGNTASGVDAALTALSAISGTVTAAAGGDVGDVFVDIYDTSGNFISSENTATDGTYDITGLAPATYTVCFDASFATGGSSTTGYASQCYKNIAWSPGSAPPAGTTAVTTTEGNTATGINAALAADGAISGTVAIGATGVGGVSVDIYSTGGNFITSAATATAGTYDITGLAPATYTVCFDASFATGGTSTTGYASQCYKNIAWSPGNAPPAGTTAVTVTRGNTATGINAALTADGAISGTVTAAITGGTGISDVTVEVFNQAGNEVTSASTATNGTYDITGLTPATYTVCFGAQSATGGGATTGYGSQCYKDVAWTSLFQLPSGTTPVAVTAGKTATGINASLPALGAISGTVTAASGGGPIEGVNVDVYNSTGAFLTEVSTATDGTYTVTGLSASATGDTVCFDATGATGGGSATGYQNQCYKDVTWLTTFTLPAGTTPVPVQAGKTATGISASLAADGAISGTVTAGITGGTGVSGVAVDIYTASNGLFTTSTTTASDGTYDVTGLSQGSYIVCFDPTSASGGGSATGYLGQCYNNVAWSPSGLLPTGTTQVTVTAANTTTGINAALPPGGAISGTVTSAGAAGINGVQVLIFNSENEEVADVSTNASGQYDATGLAPSVPYAVCFDATGATGGTSATGYQSQCYNKVAWDGGSLPPGGTTAVTATAGVTTSGINATLPPAGGISGTVTAANGGAGLANVSVDVTTSTGTFVADVVTGSGGGYSVTGLAPSATGYTVCFDASSVSSSSGGYESQCYNHVPWSPGSVSVPPGTTSVPVSLSAFTTVNAQLASEPGISGTVTSAATGKGLQGVAVRVFDNAGDYLFSANTGPAGQYTVTGLAQTGGGYILCFDATAINYASQCNGHVAWGGGFVPAIGAVPVQVNLAHPVTINAALAATGSVTGKVTASGTGTALQGVTVDVYDASHNFFAAATTGAGGMYTVTGLPGSATGYIVCFDPTTSQSATAYAGQCYKNVPWTRGATLPPGVSAVPVTAGKTTAGISAALPQAGNITGTVTAAVGGGGVHGVEADVYDSADDLIAEASTAANGTYTVTGLTPLRGYTVCFDATGPGFQSQCYKNTAWAAGTAPPAGTTPVPVTAGGTATGIGATLAPDGAVSGKVLASGGAALGQISVDVFASGGTFISSAQSASAGTYTVPGLPPSTAGYTVCFDASNATGGSSATGYQSQCYKNVPWTAGSVPPSGTTAVPVAAGKTATGINATLTPGGGISGTVTAGGAGGVSGVSVDIFNSAGVVVTTADTAAGGTYAVTGLASASYTVCFDASGIEAGFASQCYKNVAWDGAGQPAPAGTTAVGVSAGKTTPGVSAALATGASIGGTVTAASGGAGLAGVNVDVFASNGVFVTTATSAAGGGYLVAGLPPASYTVCFDTSALTGGLPDTGYADQCYKNVAWGGGTVPSGTTSVNAKAGATAAGINAALSRPGAISGTVTARTGGADLAGVMVRLYDSGGHFLTQQRTGTNGGYTISGLTPEAGYKVCFDTSAVTGGKSYAGQCYKNVAWDGSSSPVPKAATAVPVTAGKTTTGISAALAASASISGTVTAATGGGALSAVSVDVFNASGTLVAAGGTLASGTFTVTGLAPGSYTVCFYAGFATGGSSTAGYASQCYKNVAWSGTAALPKGTTPVKLTAGKAVNGINANLKNA